MSKIEKMLENEIAELKSHVRDLKEKARNGIYFDPNELIISQDMIEIKLEDMLL